MIKNLKFILALACGLASQSFAAISTAPVTSGSTEAANKLYSFLYDNYGKKTISGFMTGNNDGATSLAVQPDIQYVLEHDGNVMPALVGFDFLMTTGKNQNDGWFQGYSDNCINMAKEVWQKGGIPSFCWHWNDPSKVEEGHKASEIAWRFDGAFVAGSNTEWNTSSDAYKYLIEDIDRVSQKLIYLQKCGIAVLWRPLHEGPGEWFWWGASGAEKYVSLYRLVYDRMVNVNGVKNCIWVWNIERNTKYCNGDWYGPTGLRGPEWYPGDEYVDIIGVDVYAANDPTAVYDRNTNTSAKEFYAKIVDFFGTDKIITMSETDYIPDINEMKKDNVIWSYWMPWDQSWSKLIGVNSDAVLTSNMADDDVITLDDMPGWNTFVDYSEEDEACAAAEAKNIYEVECSADFKATKEVPANVSGISAFNLQNDDDYVALNVNLDAKGTYKVYVGYNFKYGFKQIYCAVNGVSGIANLGESDAEAADQMGETLVGSFDFKAGDNRVLLTPNWTWAIVDYVRIEKDEDAPVYDFKVSDVDGFKVDGSKLLDHCGNEFVMRGVNMSYTWFKSSAYNQLAAINKYGANTVRIVLSNGGKYSKDDASSVKKIVDQCKEYGMVAILEVHDVTGSDKIDDLVSAAEYFAGLASVLKGTEPYVIINIANEWHNSSDATNWRDGYVKAIPVIRNAGLRHCIMADAGGYGQSAATIHSYGRDVLAADVDNNVIFSIHMYGGAGNTNKIIPNIDGVINQDLALCIGEFGWFHSDGDVDEEKILDYCKSKNVGWLAWSWYGNGSPVEYLDLVKDPSDDPVLASYSDLTIKGWDGKTTWTASGDWGKLITDAWAAEAKKASLDDCTNTSVNELYFQNDNRVYVENSELVVSLDNDAVVAISDVAGRVLYRGQMDKGVNKIDLSNWNNGIYFLNADNMVAKFIKK